MSKIKCSKCSYEWLFKGNPGPQIHCPKCMKFFKNPNIYIVKTTTNAPPELNLLISKETNNSIGATA